MFQIRLFWSLRESILAPCVFSFNGRGKSEESTAQIVGIPESADWGERALGGGCPSKKIQPRQFSKIPPSRCMALVPFDSFFSCLLRR